LLGGKSTTLRTVRELKKSHPRLAFSLVIGTDNWRRRREWHCFDLVEKEVPIVVVGRKGQPRFPPNRSTMIREMIAAGEDASSYLAAGVMEHIRKFGLYGHKEP
jgi:nicotinic acid mononucleotide adenylyltransferase